MGANSSNMQAELDGLKVEVSKSQDAERWLDSAIGEMQSSLRELAQDQANAAYAYVTHEDVLSIGAFASDTVIAIKAPSGTTLEVPDPDEGMEFGQRRYQIYLRSQSGPVEVFLVSDQQGDEGASEAKCDSTAASADASRRSSKRPRADGGASDTASPQSSRARSAASSTDAASLAPPTQHEGLLKLDPITGEEDYWMQAPSGQLGVTDLFFADGINGEVKVEG